MFQINFASILCLDKTQRVFVFCKYFQKNFCFSQGEVYRVNTPGRAEVSEAAEKTKIFRKDDAKKG